MKRIMLMAINAKYIHSNLAVYSLRSNGGRYKDSILLGEYTINQHQDEVIGDIWKKKPDILFVSCYIWNISYIKEILWDIHTVMPQMPIWVGGPEVSYNAAVFLEENPHIMGVMKGEGEGIFPEILDYYNGKVRLENIKGITYRKEDDGVISDNPWREPLNLSQLSFPYDDLKDFDHRIIYYESSRGCPFSCSYCLSSVDRRLRLRNVDLVREEIQFFLDHRVPQIKFLDRTFNCSHNHAMEIWSYILEHDNGVTNFHFEVAADLINDEELSLIKAMRPGLIQLEIGVQSTNPETIKEIRRKMDFQRVRKVVREIASYHNTHQHLDLIAGLPYEDYKSFRRSFGDVYELRPEQLQLGFLKVLKGSYMEIMASQYGCYYRRKEPYEVLCTKWLSYQEMIWLKQVESMVEVYYNSRQFIYTLDELEKYYDNPFDFYEDLGRYYEEKGYNTISHSRLRRYDILLEYMDAQGDIPLDRMKELMTRDLYSRENLKRRPDWMSDQKLWQKEIREYIREQGLSKAVHIEVYQEETILYDYTNRDPLTGNVEEVTINLKRGE